MEVHSLDDEKMLRDLLRSDPQRVGELAIREGVALRVLAGMEDRVPGLWAVLSDLSDEPSQTTELVLASGKTLAIDLWHDPDWWVASVHDDPGLLAQAKSAR